MACATMANVISIGSGGCHLEEYGVVMALLTLKLCIVLRILSIFLGWVDNVLCLHARVIEPQNHG
jgi:hypothetical protein